MINFEWGSDVSFLTVQLNRKRWATPHLLRTLPTVPRHVLPEQLLDHRLKVLNELDAS